MSDRINLLVEQYKNDPDSVYNSWFVNNDERLKAFRTIKRGVNNVIDDIKKGTFGNDFKGSSLEFVLHCITEQKQIFKGAAHPFYWKPKLRIPDIYENEDNKKLFSWFLEQCLNTTNEEHLIREIILLDQKKIKGLGPAVASIIYFLHPTLVPPFNTAIVRGFNLLFNEKVKLGSWNEYLRLREIIIEKNSIVQPSLSKDLGAFAGLLFDIGERKIVLDSEELTEEDYRKIQKKLDKRRAEVIHAQEEEDAHTEIQHHLLTIGKAIGYDVVSAINDRSKCHHGVPFSNFCLKEFPSLEVDDSTYKTITLIDAVWFEKGSNNVSCAFEVEKSTSIYSGILRLTDLYYSFPINPPALYLVIPDKREKDVIMQLLRPSIRNSAVKIYYILFSDLRKNCEAICKFGDDRSIMQKLAKSAYS